MAQVIVARVVLTVFAISLAIGLGAGLASAQTPGATFVFHGDVTAERQAEIRAEWADIAAWYQESYGFREPSITVNVGSDYQSITHLLDPGHNQSWCGWQYQASMVRVDGCTSDASFVQFQLAWQHVGGSDFVVEAGQLQRGPWWLHFGLFAYVDSSYAAGRGGSLERERARRQLRATGKWSALSGLETSDAYLASVETASDLGWLAVDWLVQRAGEASYIEYATQRGRTPHWEDAFEDAFGLRPAAFYAEFSAPRTQLERVVTGATVAEADALDREGLWVSTPLYPGLNLIGWLEAPTPVGELFDAIPRAEALFVWDAPERTWRYASRNARAPYGGLDLLKPGMGIWLRLGGSNVVKWERLVVPGSSETVSLTGYADLHQGGAFVAWVDSRRSLDVLGDDLLWIQRWNSARQQWDGPHVPASAGFVRAVNDLRAGDGFWIATARSGLWRQAQARWWPDSAEPFDWIRSINFWGDVSESEQQRLRDHAAAAATFWQERVGVSPAPQGYVAADRESGRAMQDAVWGPGGIVYCGQAGTNELLLIITCDGRDSIDLGLFAHEYFHVLQGEKYRSRYYANGFVREKAPGPGWITEGSAEWARFTYIDSIRAGAYADARAGRVGAAERTTETLWDARFFLQSGMHNLLGLLATERLADRSGDASILEYFSQRAFHATSGEAFEAAFGLTPDEFYDEFAAWRAEGFPRDE